MRNPHIISNNSIHLPFPTTTTKYMYGIEEHFMFYLQDLWILLLKSVSCVFQNRIKADRSTFFQHTQTNNSRGSEQVSQTIEKENKYGWRSPHFRNLSYIAPMYVVVVLSHQNQNNSLKGLINKLVKFILRYFLKDSKYSNMRKSQFMRSKLVLCHLDLLHFSPSGLAIFQNIYVYCIYRSINFMLSCYQLVNNLLKNEFGSIVAALFVL